MAGELLTEPAPSHSPKFKRLTDADRACALRYAREGLTQTVIAQRLGVSQSAISLWLSQCHDTRAEAGQYLDGQALAISQRAVKKGTATDLIKLLTGRGVLNSDDRGSRIQVLVGVSLPGLPQTLTVQGDSQLTERALSEPNGERK